MADKAKPCTCCIWCSSIGAKIIATPTLSPVKYRENGVWKTEKTSTRMLHDKCAPLYLTWATGVKPCTIS